MKSLCHFFLLASFSILPLVSLSQDQDSTQLATIRAMPLDSNRVNAWLDLSRGVANSNYVLSQTYADSAVHTAQKIGFAAGEARAYVRLGKAAVNQSNYEVGQESYQKAYAYYDEVGLIRRKADVLNNLSVIKRDQGMFDEALGFLHQALPLYEQVNDTMGRANVFTNIAVGYAIQQDVELAEEYFLKALELFQLLKNERTSNTIYLNLGGLALESGNTEKAIEYVIKAKDYFEKNGPLTELGRTHYILGNAYLVNDELDKSEGNYLIAKGIFDDIGQNMRATGCLLRLSSVAEKRGNYSKAIDYAKESLERNTEMGLRNMTLRSLFQLESLHEQRGEYKTALDYQKQIQVVKDSLINEEKTKQIAELEEKYQSELKERELAETKADLEVQALKVRRQKVQQRILIGVVAGVVLVLLLILFQLRTNKRYSHVLEEKNAIIKDSLTEKEVLLQEIHHRVKNNLQFLSSMFNLQARHVEDPTAREMLREGKNRIHSMALVHQKLYQEDNLKGVNMSDYIPNLLDSLKHSYKVPSGEVTISSDISPISLDIDSAMPIGLILNELVTNCFKYAFPAGKSGELKVSLKEHEKFLELCVCDNGIGLAAQNLDSPAGFGIKLVKSLAEKLGGKVELKGEDGTQTNITITNYIKA